MFRFLIEVLCQSLLYQQGDSIIYIYTFFPLRFIPGDAVLSPVLHIRTLLFIHSKCNSLHLPTQPLDPSLSGDQGKPTEERDLSKDSRR